MFKRKNRDGARHANTEGLRSADSTGNFYLGPYITSVDVNQYGAVGGPAAGRLGGARGGETSGVTVHRAPLHNHLPAAIPVPTGESEFTDDDSSSTYTNSTQGMVSSLTSLGSKELSLSLWGDPNRDSRRSKREKYRRDVTQDNNDKGENVLYSRDQGRSPSPTRGLGHSVQSMLPDHRPLPPLPTQIPQQGQGISVIPVHNSTPELHRSHDPNNNSPNLHRDNLHRGGSRELGAIQAPPLYIGRAMRYNDYHQANEPQWAHDFGLTDQTQFRPPKPYKPPKTRAPPVPPPRQNQRQHLQVYRYGGYQAVQKPNYF